MQIAAGLTGEYSRTGLFHDHIGTATGSRASTQGPAVDQLVAIIRVRICPWADARNKIEYIRTNTYDILNSYRQNVVIVEQVGVAD